MWINNKNIVYIIQYKDNKIIDILSYLIHNDTFEYMLKLPSGKLKHKIGDIEAISQDIKQHYGSINKLNYLFKVIDIESNKSVLEHGGIYNISDIKNVFLNAYNRHADINFAY